MRLHTTQLSDHSFVTLKPRWLYLFSPCMITVFHSEYTRYLCHQANTHYLSTWGQTQSYCGIILLQICFLDYFKWALSIINLEIKVLSSCVEGRRPVLGKAESDKPKNGSNKLARFGYWVCLGGFFDWLGWWTLKKALCRSNRWLLIHLSTYILASQFFHLLTNLLYYWHFSWLEFLLFPSCFS